MDKINSAQTSKAELHSCWPVLRSDDWSRPHRGSWPLRIVAIEDGCCVKFRNICMCVNLLTTAETTDAAIDIGQWRDCTCSTRWWPASASRVPRVPSASRSVNLHLFSGRKAQIFAPPRCMHKRGLCCRRRAVPVWYLSRSCTMSKRLQIRPYGMRIGNPTHAFEWYHFNDLD